MISADFPGSSHARSGACTSVDNGATFLLVHTALWLSASFLRTGLAHSFSRGFGLQSLRTSSIWSWAAARLANRFGLCEEPISTRREVAAQSTVSSFPVKANRILDRGRSRQLVVWRAGGETRVS